MMSPLSVSYFLEAETYKFDMVIFDEASQIFPQDAIGAICRGKQVVIAGDSKQLPPTSFFAASTNNLDGEYDSEEEEEEVIYDSILEEATNSLPNRSLLWHYRSRNEDLIAFSNQEIYKNKLTTFPSSNTVAADSGVEYVYVENGTYSGRCNIHEARKCVELIKEHITKHPERSLGIIAFSEKQQATIEEAVHRFRESNPRYEKFFAEDREEPFFVKNLENVQGDERDTIIFSICYAKDTIILTEEEKEAYEKEKAYASIPTVKNNRGFPRFSHPNKDVRDFLWQIRSYFPNNYLHFRKYKDEIDFEIEAKMFAEVLSGSVNEQQFQKYIKENRKWFIPGSIFLDYNFGHHDAYLFPEQKLGPDYIADYMLIGKNSDGYSIVLVEFENANTEFILKTENTEAESVRKGLTQIRDWKRWLDSNRDFFLRNVGLINYGIDIPTYRIYYYLVVSRREYMNDRATELRSQLMYEMQNLKIVSFDRLVDNVCKLEGYNSW